MADPWTSQCERLTGGTRRPGHAGRRVRLRDLRPRRRRVPRCRLRGSSSGTPGSCPAGPCGSTARPPRALARAVPDPYSATFVARTRPRPGRADSNLMVERRRYVGRGMREDLVVRNFGEEPAYCAVELVYGADFADLFAVKEARVTGPRRAGRRSRGRRRWSSATGTAPAGAASGSPSPTRPCSTATSPGGR